jgi:pimeloyl-ACP methyl ester carboxylesterase
MKHTTRARWILTLVILFFLVVFVGPFLIPVPPLAGTVPPEQLADPDSRFVEVNGLRVHYKMAGQGVPVMVLMHGFAASVFSWREVMEPLAERGTVIAFDRPAFGLTERPMPGTGEGQNPYSAESQANLTVALLDELSVDKGILIGNSAGGTIATLVALNYPDRVEALVLVDAAIYSGSGSPAWTSLLFTLPQMRRLGPLVARSLASRGEDLARLAWHDPSKITAEAWEGYRKPLRVQNWDQALWQLTLASRPLGLEKRLNEIHVPTLVISGDDDRVVPTAQSVRLARELPNAELVIIPACGHVPHEECPEPFLLAVEDFLNRLR